MWEQQCAAFQPLCPNRDSVDHTLKHSADYNSAAEKHWCGIKRSKQLKWDDGDVKREWKCQGGVWVDDTHTYTQRERKHQNKNQSKKQKLLEVPAEDYYYSPPQKGEDMNGWGGGGGEQQGGGREGGGVSRVVQCLWGFRHKLHEENQIYELEDRNSHKWPRRFNDMKITNIQLKIRKLAEMSHLYSSYYICTSLRKKCEQLYTTSYSWTLLHWLCKVKCKKSFCDWLF